MAEANAASDADPSVLRVSIDSKAKVKVGNLSRGGKDRRQQAPKADDHDMEWQHVLIPFGILNLQTDDLTIYLGESAETPDFIVDCLARWWEDNRPKHSKVTTLAINLDGGSATRSDRTQFIKRMVTLARETGLTLELIYYPPYHSKYNPIERCWAALEQFWNGAILDSIETTLQWASNMMWQGMQPVVHHVTDVYEKGIKVDPETLATFRVDWHPLEDLPKWAITINPA